MSAPTQIQPQTGTASSEGARHRVAEAVAELNRAVHKIGMYPPEHPLVPAAVEGVRALLLEALGDRAALRFGVARDRIVFDEEPLDEKNPALQWVARTLHASGVGVLEISRQASSADLTFLVNWLYRARRALGHDSGRELAQAAIPGLSVELVDYERLAFSERCDADVDTVWVSLARALLRDLPAGDSFAPADELPDKGSVAPRARMDELALSPEWVARGIGGSLQAGGEERDRLSRRLEEVGRRVGQLGPGVREAVQQRMATMVSKLSPDLRRQLLTLVVGPEDSWAPRARGGDSVTGRSSPVVLEVLGEVDRAGEAVPPGIIALFGKLGDLTRTDAGATVRADAPAASGEDEQMRGTLRTVFTRSAGGSRNPEAYQGLLERISREDSIAEARFDHAGRYRDPGLTADLHSTASGVAARLLIENAAGGDVAALLERVVSSLAPLLKAGSILEAADGLAAVRHLAGGALPSDETRKRVEEYLASLGTPEIVDLLLDLAGTAGEEDLSRLGKLFEAGGAESVARALAVLPGKIPGPARDRAVQLLSFASHGALEAGFEAMRAEGDEALRAAIPLLRRIPAAAGVAIAQTVWAHADSAIRIEAFRSLISLDRRDGAFLRHVELALWDSDRSIGRFVLQLLKGRTDAASCLLLSRYVAGEFGLNDQDLRLEAVSVLSAAGTAASRDALIKILLSRRLTLSKPDLALRVAAEKALAARRDSVSMRALRRWQWSLPYWKSLLVIRRSS